MLWNESRPLAQNIASDVIDLQEVLTGQDLPREQLLGGLVEGLLGDPQHKCKGRSAPSRLARALEIADEKGVAVKAIRELAEREIEL